MKKSILQSVSEIISLNVQPNMPRYSAKKSVSGYERVRVVTCCIGCALNSVSYLNRVGFNAVNRGTVIIVTKAF